MQVRGLRGRQAGGGGGGGEGLLIYIYIHISGLAHLPGLGATHVCANWTLRRVAQLAAFNFRSAGRTGCRHPEGAAAGAEAASTAAAQGGGRGRLQRKRVGVQYCIACRKAMTGEAARGGATGPGGVDRPGGGGGGRGCLYTYIYIYRGSLTCQGLAPPMCAPAGPLGGSHS